MLQRHAVRNCQVFFSILEPLCIVARLVFPIKTDEPGILFLSLPTSSSIRSRIKIVVTQNFNKTHPFGLAFIKLHSPPSDNSTSSSSVLSLNIPVGFGEIGTEVATRTAAAPPAGGAVSGSRFTRSKREPALIKMKDG